MNLESVFPESRGEHTQILIILLQLAPFYDPSILPIAINKTYLKAGQVRGWIKPTCARDSLSL